MNNITLNNITLSTILAITLLTTTSSAAVGGKNALNGQPFTSLEELITANASEIKNNTRLIEASAVDIANNTVSITTLQGKIDGIDATLSSLESRIITNESNIDAANTAIANNETAIEDLTISVSASILTTTSDILGLKTSVASLSDDMKALQVVLNEKIANLNTAIANNSADIMALSAIVTTMNASLTGAQTNILDLLTRIGMAEVALNNHTTALALIDTQLGLLDLIITALDDGTATTGNREIVLNGTAAADYAPGELKTLISNLNISTDDYIYIKATNSQGTSEICTANDQVVTVINYFANDGPNYLGQVKDDTLTMVKGLGSSTWRTSSYAQFNFWYDQSYYQYFTISSSDSTGNYMTTGLIEPFSSNYVGYDMLANDYWDISRDASLTIRAGATRQEACGF